MEMNRDNRSILGQIQQVKCINMLVTEEINMRNLDKHRAIVPQQL